MKYIKKNITNLFCLAGCNTNSVCAGKSFCETIAFVLVKLIFEELKEWNEVEERCPGATFFVVVSNRTTNDINLNG